MSVFLLLVVTSASGCDATHQDTPDAGPAHDAPAVGDAPPPRDARPPELDAPPTRDAPPPPLGSLGRPCDAGACAAGLSCGTGVVVTILELDGGTREEIIGEGHCTRRCSPDATGACDAGTACAASVFFGAGRVSLLDASGQGFCLPLVDHASLWHPLEPPEPDPWRPPLPCTSEPVGPVVRPECALPCGTDADCFYEPVSVRPAVFREIAPTGAIECDHFDGACRHWGSHALGSACTSDLDCRWEHVCWGGADWRTPGVCVVPTCDGCDGAGVECVDLEPGSRGCASIAP